MPSILDVLRQHPDFYPSERPSFFPQNIPNAFLPTEAPGWGSSGWNWGGGNIDDARRHPMEGSYETRPGIYGMHNYVPDDPAFRAYLVAMIAHILGRA